MDEQFSGADQDFVTGGEVRYGSIGGLQYEVPQSRLYCLCINVALCSTALQCICRVIRRSSMTMKANTYYIIFGRPPIGGKLTSPLPPGGATVYTHYADGIERLTTHRETFTLLDSHYFMRELRFLVFSSSVSPLFIFLVPRGRLN